MHLPERFLALTLPRQIDSVYRTKDRDVTRLVSFINHCHTAKSIRTELNKLDKDHRDKFETMVRIFNLTQTKNLSFDSVGAKMTMERKFEALNALLDVVIKGQSNGMLVCGAAGIGKSHTVEEALNKAKVKYHLLRGYSSPAELYNFLYEFRSSTILIDDADSVFSELTTLNILKAILETRPDRVVSWRTPSPAITAPQTFTFTGKVIFITNLSVEKINMHMSALLSRVLYVSFDVSSEDVIRRIKWIARTTNYKTLSRDQRIRVASFIASNKDMIRDLSLRSLVHGYDLFLHDQSKWRRNLRFMWGARQ